MRFPSTLPHPQSLLQAEQSQLLQPFPTEEVLQSLDHLGDPSLGSLQNVKVSFLLEDSASNHFFLRKAQPAKQKSCLDWPVRSSIPCCFLISNIKTLVKKYWAVRAPTTVNIGKKEPSLDCTVGAWPIQVMWAGRTGGSLAREQSPCRSCFCRAAGGVFLSNHRVCCWRWMLPYALAPLSRTSLPIKYFAKDSQGDEDIKSEWKMGRIINKRVGQMPKHIEAGDKMTVPMCKHNSLQNN